MTEVTNLSRLFCAAEALTNYARRQYHDPADRDLSDPANRQQIAQDLVNDLCHALAAVDVDPERTLVNAFSSYDEENREQLRQRLHARSGDGARSRALSRQILDKQADADRCRALVDTMLDGPLDLAGHRSIDKAKSMIDQTARDALSEAADLAKIVQRFLNA